MAHRTVLVNDNREKVIVLLTDGEPTTGRSRAIANAGLAKRDDVRLIAIGVDDDADRGFFQQIASTPEDCYFAAQSVQLASTFSGIAGRLVAETSRGGGLTKL